tara:strand:- start:30616 stop:32865 length:2250 start_codon:yes stop_codon:yes gene_type:complete
MVSKVNKSKENAPTNTEKKQPVLDRVYTWEDDNIDDIFEAKNTTMVDDSLEGVYSTAAIAELDDNEDSSILAFNELAAASDEPEAASKSDKLQAWIESIEDLYGEPEANSVQNSGSQAVLHINHKFPLHYLAAHGDITNLTLLLENSYIDTRDTLDSTPLHVAILSNQQAVVELLVDNGANINALAYDGYSPLMLAIKKQHLDTVDYLLSNDDIQIESGELWLTFELLMEAVENSDGNETSALQHILSIVERMAALMEVAIFEDEDYHPVTGELVIDSIPISLGLEMQAVNIKNPLIRDMMLQTVKNIQAFDHSHEPYVQTKLLTHMFAVEGNFELAHSNVNNLGSYHLTSIEAEGFVGAYTVPAAQKYLEQYLETKQHDLSPEQAISFNHLKLVLSEASTLTQASRSDDLIQHLFEQFQQGEILFIPTGWEGHFVVNIIDAKNGYFITSNTGQAYDNFESGSIVYKMHHPEKITPENIEQIANNEDRFALEYEFFYELGLEEIAVLPASHQTVGNCAWRSVEVAVEAFTYLDLLERGYDASNASELAQQWYQDWFDFTKESHLVDYLTSNENIDINLLGNLLVQGHPSLFHIELEPELDFDFDFDFAADSSVNGSGNLNIPVSAHELHTANLIIQALAQPQYADDVGGLLENFSAAKSELISLFSTYNLAISKNSNLEATVENFEPSLSMNTESTTIQLDDVVQQDDLFQDDNTSDACAIVHEVDILPITPATIYEQPVESHALIEVY